MPRSARRSRRPSRKPRDVQAIQNVNNSIRDLIVTTQNKSSPAIHDIQPMKRSKRPQVCTFQVKVFKVGVTADNVGVAGAYTFALTDTPSPTDFTSLFDQYRIQQVQVEFLPVVSPFGASTTASSFPTLITALDYDDATPGGTTVLQQFGNSQAVYNQQYHVRTLTPRFSINAYSGIFGSFALAPVGAWIDSNSPGVQYYGVKWATSAVSVVSGSYLLYNVLCTYTIQCRNNI